MPRGDRTGPTGLGSMTGRGLGYCAGYSTPGYMAPGWGFGRGGGRGRGRGYWRGYDRMWGAVYPPYAPYVMTPHYYPREVNITPETQIAVLEQEKQYLNLEMESIKAALEDISKNIEKLKENK